MGEQSRLESILRNIGRGVRTLFLGSEDLSCKEYQVLGERKHRTRKQAAIDQLIETGQIDLLPNDDVMNSLYKAVVDDGCTLPEGRVEHLMKYLVENDKISGALSLAVATGRFDQGLTILQETLAREDQQLGHSPFSPDWETVAWFYLKAGKPEMAIPAYLRQADLHKGSLAESHYNLKAARLFKQLGNHEEASNLFRPIIDLQIRNGRFYPGDYDEAFKLCEESGLDDKFIEVSEAAKVRFVEAARRAKAHGLIDKANELYVREFEYRMPNAWSMSLDDPMVSLVEESGLYHEFFERAEAVADASLLVDLVILAKKWGMEPKAGELINKVESSPWAVEERERLYISLGIPEKAAAYRNLKVLQSSLRS